MTPRSALGQQKGARSSEATPFPSVVPPPVAPGLLQVGPGGGQRVVRSLGVAGLVAGVVGTGLPIGVAGPVRVQTLIGRLDHRGQVTGAGVRRREEPVSGRGDRCGAVRSASRVRG